MCVIGQPIPSKAFMDISGNFDNFVQDLLLGVCVFDRVI